MPLALVLAALAAAPLWLRGVVCSYTAGSAASITRSSASSGMWHGFDSVLADVAHAACMNDDLEALLMQHGGESAAFQEAVASAASAQALSHVLPSRHADGDVDGVHLLHAACSLGDAAAVISLLRAGVPVNLRTRLGATCILVAADAGHGRLIATLAQALASAPPAMRFDVNARGFDECPPLVLALRGVYARASKLASAHTSPHAEAVHALLGAGADVNAGCRGVSPNGNVPRRVLRDPSTSDYGTIAFPSHPVHVCARADDADMLRALLARGATLEQGNAFGATALMIASFHDRMAAMGVLLRAGASVDAHTHTQARITALGMAVRNAHSRAIALLMQAGADATVALPDGEPPLTVLASKGCVACMDALTSTYARTDADTDSNTATLAEQVQEADKYGLTPLLHACAQRQVAAVEWLVRAGADRFVTSRGRTCLSLAAAVPVATVNVTSDTVEALLRAIDASRHQAFLNVPNDVGMPAIAVAVRNGQENLALALLSAGAAWNFTLPDGQSFSRVVSDASVPMPRVQARVRALAEQLAT